MGRRVILPLSCGLAAVVAVMLGGCAAVPDESAAYPDEMECPYYSPAISGYGYYDSECGYPPYGVGFSIEQFHHHHLHAFHHGRDHGFHNEHNGAVLGAGHRSSPIGSRGGGSNMGSEVFPRR